MSIPRHITIDCFGRVFEVTDIVDRFGNITEDPSIASACVVNYLGTPVVQDADDIPIYTVH